MTIKTAGDFKNFVSTLSNDTREYALKVFYAYTKKGLGEKIVANIIAQNINQPQIITSLLDLEL